MKTLSVLIGPPAIGKTTWIKEHAPGASVINRDDVIERISAMHGITYNDAYLSPPQGSEIGQLVVGMEQFGKVVPSDLKWRELDYEVPQKVHRKANDELLKRAADCATGNNDVVLDMTNMDKASRAMYMAPFGDDFHKIAVVFNFHSTELIDAIKRNAHKRGEELQKQGRPKTISGEVIDRMVAAYEVPEKSEGFDDIISYDSSSHLLGKDSADNVREDSNVIIGIIRRVIREISGK